MSEGTLFAYGTLRDSDILAGVLGRALPPTAMRSATAPGYHAVYCPGAVYPVLTPAPAAAAPGLLLTGLTQADFAILDAFEGPLYRLGSILVRTEAGDATAFTYLPVTPTPADAAAWTLEHWTLHHKPAVLVPELLVAEQARRGLAEPGAIGS